VNAVILQKSAGQCVTHVFALLLADPPIHLARVRVLQIRRL